MPESPRTVSMPTYWWWLFPLGLGGIGSGLGFAVRPVFTWMMNLFESAPAPLRIVAVLPTFWAVLVLTVLGVLGGVFLAGEARKDALTVKIDETGVELMQRGKARFVPADRIDSVMIDGKELVILDAETREHAREKADDLDSDELESAFVSYGYRWRADDPFDERFESWVDGKPGLAEPLHKLLRERGRARTDGKAGTVEALTERLRDEGIAVRDRGERQQFRRVG